MRRRDRWVGQVWLARMTSQAAEGVALEHDTAGMYTIGEALALITGYGYAVELEGGIDRYSLRLLPMYPPATGRLNMPAISYLGPNLLPVLSVAAYEITALADSVEIAVLANREKPRWVQP